MNLRKLDWLEKALEIYKFHIQHLKEDETWTLVKTATALNRSLGSVSQDVMIGDWYRTHEKQLRRCSSMQDAVAWIKVRKREIKIGD